MNKIVKNIFKLSKETDRNAFAWIDLDQYSLGNRISRTGLALGIASVAYSVVGYLIREHSGQSAVWKKNRDDFKETNKQMKKMMDQWTRKR